MADVVGPGNAQRSRPIASPSRAVERAPDQRRFNSNHRRCQSSDESITHKKPAYWDARLRDLTDDCTEFVESCEKSASFERGTAKSTPPAPPPQSVHDRLTHPVARHRFPSHHQRPRTSPLQQAPRTPSSASQCHSASLPSLLQLQHSSTRPIRRSTLPSLEVRGRDR